MACLELSMLDKVVKLVCKSACRDKINLVSRAQKLLDGTSSSSNVAWKLKQYSKLTL